MTLDETILDLCGRWPIPFDHLRDEVRIRCPVTDDKFAAAVSRLAADSRLWVDDSGVKLRAVEPKPESQGRLF